MKLKEIFEALYTGKASAEDDDKFDTWAENWGNQYHDFINKSKFGAILGVSKTDFETPEYKMAEKIWNKYKAQFIKMLEEDTYLNKLIDKEVGNIWDNRSKLSGMFLVKGEPTSEVSDIVEAVITTIIEKCEKVITDKKDCDLFIKALSQLGYE